TPTQFPGLEQKIAAMRVQDFTMSKELLRDAYLANTAAFYEASGVNRLPAQAQAGIKAQFPKWFDSRLGGDNGEVVNGSDAARLIGNKLTIGLQSGNPAVAQCTPYNACAVLDTVRTTLVDYLAGFIRQNPARHAEVNIRS
ncbi:hypothetical protein HYU18_05175, partial [Candidatus Woesearchaeota archaeon]|nr:hypothetical protein [Candidatus Woesearchaeota archaeon]